MGCVTPQGRTAERHEDGRLEPCRDCLRLRRFPYGFRTKEKGHRKSGLSL